MQSLTVARFERLKRGIKTRTLLEKTGIKPLRYIHFEGAREYRHLTEEELNSLAGFLEVPPGSLADERGAPRVIA